MLTPLPSKTAIVVAIIIEQRCNPLPFPNFFFEGFVKRRKTQWKKN
jgi:hypothetical protein